MINWTINVGTPILTPGMYFLVKYRKKPSMIWIQFTPNPNTNQFTIPNLEKGEYEAEISTICTNGEISTPVNISNGASGSNPPIVNIRWNDGTTSDLLCNSTSCPYVILVDATDPDNDITTIEALVSYDNGLNWNTFVANVTNGIFGGSLTSGSVIHKVKVTDAVGNIATSNELKYTVSEETIPAFVGNGSHYFATAPFNTGIYEDFVLPIPNFLAVTETGDYNIIIDLTKNGNNSVPFQAYLRTTNANGGYNQTPIGGSITTTSGNAYLNIVKNLTAGDNLRVFIEYTLSGYIRLTVGWDITIQKV